MAIAFGINSGGKILNPSSISMNKSNQTFSSYPILSVSKRKIPETRIFASTIPSSNSAVISPPSGEAPLMDESYKEKDVGVSEKIDSWMQKSVVHIVRNLKQAPLLVHIYSENGGASEIRSVKLKTEKAHLEDWSVVKSEWENGESKTPDGLIFVEELKQDEEIAGEECVEEGVARAWGIVVQGKGVECGPACYLLKTNRVCGGMELGFCTHFCLMRVKNFRDSAFQQFKDSWLLQ